MLSGANDELIPPEHMRGLWGLVRRRGRSAETKEGDAVTVRREEEKEGEREVEERPWVEGVRAEEDAGTASRYVEFELGTHSEYRVSLLFYFVGDGDGAFGVLPMSSCRRRWRSHLSSQPFSFLALFCAPLRRKAY